MAHPLEVAQLGDEVLHRLQFPWRGGRITYAFQPLLEHLEADMIDKIKTKMFSRRSAFSLLGLPAALGFAAAPMVPDAVRCRRTDGHGRAGATQGRFGFAGRRIARRFHVGRA